MTMNCPPLLLPPPTVPSIQSHRLLISSARRRETAMIRERWKQNQKKMTSRVRMHPLSAPPDLSASSRSVMSALRKSMTYGRCQDVSTPSSTHKHLQFPFLETEVTKGNLTQRLPYFVPVHVQSAPERDYPTQCTTYSDVFFLSASGAPPQDGTPRCKSARKERFFIHPEWASEDVSWKRFQHRSNPDQFRYSWM